MKKNIIIYILIALSQFAAKAQETVYGKADSIFIETILDRHQRCRYSSTGELALAIAGEFEGTKYVSNTLDNDSCETLYISHDRLDCTTFVELVTAMTISAVNEEKSFDSVCRNLEMIRYRGGKRNGYQSRLHYISWWIDDNYSKGVVKEVTVASPHKQHILDINYMSTHPDSYPQLKGNDTARNEIETYELPYRNKATSYIPKEKLHLDSKRLDIRNGDIIALVTTIKGLDVSHVGFAFWDGDSLHMMHASSKEKAVIRDKHTLYRYQKNNKSQTGIRVIRILPETLK